jgi:hypothetical protein
LAALSSLVPPAVNCDHFLLPDSQLHFFNSETHLALPRRPGNSTAVSWGCHESHWFATLRSGIIFCAWYPVSWPTIFSIAPYLYSIVQEGGSIQFPLVHSDLKGRSLR